MSDDLLLLSIDQNAQAVAPLRSNPPLYAAMASCEDVGPDPLDSLAVGLAEYIRSPVGPVEPVHSLPFCTGHGYTYALTVFADATLPEAQRTAAFRAFLPLAQRMSALMGELPDRMLKRLGIRSTFGTPLHDWVWVLFHLAWHFPGYFARGVVHRDRLLRSEGRVFVAPEDWLQLGGVSGAPEDCHPGLIFSRFPSELDLVTATGIAIDLLRQAVRGGNPFEITDALRNQMLHLHQEFTAVGTLFDERRSGPLGTDLDVRVLRLDSSFRTPPASQWAGYQAGGAIQENLFLGRSGPVKEVCVLRGPSVGDFTRRANQAGALLPAWPEHPAPALLQDACVWLLRVARRHELQSEQYSYVTEDQSPPHGQPVPRSQVTEHYWASTRPFTGWGGPVTDHRGNVERWLGFVLYTLKEYQPDSVEIRVVPDEAGAVAYGWNATLTLRGMNLYQASARAMELAGWVRPAGGVGAQQPSAQRRAGEDVPPGLRFDDPWEDAPYPPPGAGRYVRFHRGGRSPSREPEWRPGWAWAERPEDGWVECGECRPGPAPVPIARGRPPAVCDWLPAEWPAAFYPLGGAGEHVVGWRELVRSVLGHDRDTIPPDDPEYGWRTLTRATRHLAHHLGVIPLERFVAPLPASRDEARREVEPLLDGLVLARGGTNGDPQRPSHSRAGQTPAATTPTEADTHRTPPPAASGLVTEVEQLLAEARRAYADDLGFTLVAVPCGDGADGVDARQCEAGSPDAGQIRDGVFYWPFQCVRHFGTVTVAGVGSFVLVALDASGDSLSRFSEFGGRAAAAVLASGVPWAGLTRPGPGFTTWATVVMFSAPSARNHAVTQATGPRILSSPWASSIAALRDILSLPTPTPVQTTAAGSPPHRDVPSWDATARRLLFRGQVCKQFARPAQNQERILAAFQEEGWPDAVDDPLPAGKLASTVESLNDRLRTVKFRLNGAGTGVCWQPG